MRAGSVISIPDQRFGPRGERMVQPGLPGRWSIWSQVGTGPGHHAVTPVDDAARATGLTHAVVRITQSKNSVIPTVLLVATQPAEHMPKPYKSQENAS